MHSLRNRLLYRTSAVLILTLFTAAVALYLLIRTSLFAELDASLLLEAASLATHVEQSGDEVQIEPAVATLPEYSSAEQPRYFQVWAADGRSAFRSPSLAGQDLPLPAMTIHQTQSHLSAKLPNGKPGRLATVVFQPRLEDDDDPADRTSNRPPATIVVARSTAEIDAALARLAALLSVVTVATVIVCVVLTGGVVSRELEPLRSLAGSIEQLGAADMSQRIDIAECPSELWPVVDCLNQLLGRLEAALAREKSFTADVAHELRTPLAGLETTLEVCASRSREVDAYQTVIANCLGITRGLHAMVDNLLRLARADANQFPLKFEPHEIAALIRESWSSFAQRATDRDLSVEWILDGPLHALADYESAHHIFSNLYDNAVTYTETGGQIRTSVAIAGNRCVITIANSGCALKAQDIPRVFDRFWRGDMARTSAGLRCGLGLSLCRKLVELHHGVITAEVRDGWFSIRVELDAAPARP
ncbi:MAG TPA: ATP-binding protein [Planctomycetaceae bacterium]|jgi:heavy metal sensor kinase